MMDRQLRLLASLGYNSDSEVQVILDLLEVVGRLVLMLHWQRGVVDMCVQIGAIPLEGEWRENWDRVIADINTFEKRIWEVAPARAMLPLMQHFRVSGELLEDYEKCLAKDTHGRVPYNEANLDDIEDLLRRVIDCRKAEANVRST